MISREDARALERARGYADLEPELAWALEDRPMSGRKPNPPMRHALVVLVLGTPACVGLQDFGDPSRDEPSPVGRARARRCDARRR
jgi:hypothetical protein